MTRNRACLAITAVLSALAAAPSLAYAAEGDLDTSFNSTGTELTPITPSKNDVADGVAIDSQGRIVAAGTTDVGGQHVFAVTRYLPSGALDTSFNSTGTETQAIGAGGDDQATGVAVDSQGRIVVGGYSKSSTEYDFAVARFTPDGHLDNTGPTSFGPFGFRTTQIGSSDAHATALAVDSQDRVILAGESRIGAQQVATLARYNADGTLDSNFGTGGTVTLPFGSGVNAMASGVAIDSQGRIVIAGRAVSTTTNDQFVVARYLPGGTLDSSFGGGAGYVITPVTTSDNQAFSVAVDPEGRIVAAGTNTDANSNDEFTAVRYRPDGTLDSSFGTGGVAFTPIGADNAEARDVAIDPQGRPVLAGFATVNSAVAFAVVRYRTDGSPDSAFGSNGVVTTNIGTGSPISGGASALGIDSKSRIVAAGSAANGSNLFDFAVARYIGDQTPPKVTITSGPADGAFTNDPTPSFGWSSDDPTASYACGFDGATPSGCTSPATPVSALVDGAHTFSVSGSDTVGNASAPATRTFIVDTTPPTLTIKGKRRVRSRHRARDRFRLKVNEPAIVVCKLDRKRTRACSNRYRTPKLRFGKHKLRVTAVDRAGNVSMTLKRFKIVRKRH
jgi:uncharacterized delta-60 repeat protein